MNQRGKTLTSVGSVPRSSVIPFCSLVDVQPSVRSRVDSTTCKNELGDSKQIIAIDAFVVSSLFVSTDSTCVHHQAPLRVGLGVQKVIAF